MRRRMPLLLSSTLLGLLAAARLSGALVGSEVASRVAAHKWGCQSAGPVGPAIRKELMAAREAVWRAWFAGDRARLEAVIPEETIAINAGEEAWVRRAEILGGARQFVESGSKLVRLEFPRTEIQLYGDVAILYSDYLYEVETKSQRETHSGRGTEIFVHRHGRWVNSGWHTDSEPQGTSHRTN